MTTAKRRSPPALSIFSILALFSFGACSSGSSDQSGSGSEQVFGDSADFQLDGTKAAAADITAPDCPQLVPGPALGLSCLHCGAPAARSQALKLADMMAASCRAQIAVTMLVDGTFSDDRAQLEEVISRITAGDSGLHLYLYFSNGPWQRRHGSVPEHLGIGAAYSPEEFRKLVKTDNSVRNSYAERIRWAVPLMRYAEEQGATVYVIPMLEDNFDQSAARAVEALFEQSMPADLSVVYGRNPCPGCWPGNDSSVPSGMIRDVHLGSPNAVSTSGGLVSNDGLNLVFPGASSDGHSINFEQMKSVIAEETALGNDFVIWHRPYQGVGPDNVFADPAVRNYVMPSPAEEQSLHGLLSSDW